MLRYDTHNTFVKSKRNKMRTEIGKSNTQNVWKTVCYRYAIAWWLYIFSFCLLTSPILTCAATELLCITNDASSSTNILLVHENRNFTIGKTIHLLWYDSAILLLCGRSGRSAIYFLDRMLASQQQILYLPRCLFLLFALRCGIFISGCFVLTKRYLKCT